MYSSWKFLLSRTHSYIFKFRLLLQFHNFPNSVSCHGLMKRCCRPIKSRDSDNHTIMAFTIEPTSLTFDMRCHVECEHDGGKWRVSWSCRAAVRHGQSTHWIGSFVKWRKPVPSELRLPTPFFKFPLQFVYIATTLHIIDGNFRPRYRRIFVRMRQPLSKAHQVRADRGEFAGLIAELPAGLSHI